MVDTLCSTLVQSSLLRCLQRRNIPNVGDGVSRNTRTDFVVLIVLIVEKQVLLVLWVQDLPLVSVGSTFIRCDGQNHGCLLVCHVIDRQRVLVVAVANLTANIGLIGATVDEALSIVNVAILGCTMFIVSGVYMYLKCYPNPPARGRRLRRIGDINKDNTRLALVSARRRTDRVDEVRFRVCHNVVRATRWQALVMASEIRRVAEDLWRSRVDRK